MKILFLKRILEPLFRVSCFFLLIFLSSRDLSACDVPVFRYALERWTADPYRLIIYPSGQMDNRIRAALNDLMKSSFSGDSTLNLLVQYADQSRKDIDRFESGDHSGLVLLYPNSTGIPYPAWTGKLSVENLRLLQDSPVRREVARRLLSGDAAVFIFLEIGDPQLDMKWYQIVQENLDRLKEAIKIPNSGLDIQGNLIKITAYDDKPLNFSLLKISRRDPLENIFVSQLLGTESDLSDYQVPMVFPVFGQGRSLYALVGEGINSITLEKSCTALAAWCSCEIKALHQGIDLLFQVDWSRRVGGDWVREQSPALTGLSAFVPDESSQDTTDTTGKIAAEKSAAENKALESEISTADKNKSNASSDPQVPPSTVAVANPVVINTLAAVLGISVFIIVVTVVLKLGFNKNKL